MGDSSQSGGQPPLVREAVGVFDDAASLEAAVDALLSNGFDRADISLLAGESAVEEKLGHLYQRVEALEDDPSAPRVAFVSTEAIGDAQGALIGGLTYVGAVAAAGTMVASGGTMAGAILAAALAGGSGGLIGSVLAGIVEDRHAQTLQRQIEHGGLLLWVRTRDEVHEKRAVSVLAEHSAHDVHVHGLPDRAG